VHATALTCFPVGQVEPCTTSGKLMTVTNAMSEFNAITSHTTRIPIKKATAVEIKLDCP
jgi:hypothetical protein